MSFSPGLFLLDYLLFPTGYTIVQIMTPTPTKVHIPYISWNVGKCSINYDDCLAGTRGPRHSFSRGDGEMISPEGKRCSQCLLIPEEIVLGLRCK